MTEDAQRIYQYKDSGKTCDNDKDHLLQMHLEDEHFYLKFNFKDFSGV